MGIGIVLLICLAAYVAYRALKWFAARQRRRELNREALQLALDADRDRLDPTLPVFWGA